MFKHLRSMLFALLLPVSAHTADISVPEELADWQDWVMHGEEYRSCPFLFNSAASQRSSYVCAWPGRLVLSVDTDGGRFDQQWTVYGEEQWLALPGDASHWPHEVTVNGQSAEVLAPKGAPSVRLAPGSYRIAGRFEWDERPGVLALPTDVGLIALTVDGNSIARPEIGRKGVFLGERRRETQARDSVTTQVYRLVADDVPTRLVTILQIDIAGGVREELFGPVLLTDFVPLTLDSQLPARLEADGNLRVQVRPGRWQITLDGRAPGVLDEISLAPPGANLPTTEIWSYRSNERLRVTAPEGLPPVDPSQVQVPDTWQELPAFRIESGQALSINERSRGKVAADNELSLDRKMWLDYAGQGFTVADSIGGTMRVDWRLDMARPFELLSASERGESLLITEGLDEGLTGIEVRQTHVDVDAIGRAETRDAMSVNGWQARFAAVTTELNLPPGNKLLAAPGADAAPGSWVSQWQLLDYFLVLIITIATWKLFGPGAGIVAFTAVALSFHESNAPGWLWLNLLVAIALLRVAPSGRLRQSVRVYQALSVLALLVVLVPFVATQLRIAIYPQLEPQYAARYQPIAADQADLVGMTRQRKELPESVALSETPLEEITVAAKSVRRYSRYAPNAIVQAGPGIPSWQWNTYYLSWSGPIDSDQEVRLMILPRWLVTILRFIEVGLLLLFSAVLAAEIFARPFKVLGRLNPRSSGSSAGLIAVVSAALLVGVPEAQAQTPDPALLDELRSRLLQPPDCVPRCAEIASADVDIGPDAVAMRLDIHAAEGVALPLPGSLAGWRPEAIMVDASSRARVFRSPDQRLWLHVPSGRHEVSLRGGIPDVDSLEIPFATPPRFIEARSDDWLIAGIKDRRLLAGSLQLTRLQGEQADDETARWESSRFPTFVRVERSIDLDLDWQATTSVVRIAPAQGAVTLDLPLIVGETVLSDDYRVENGRILVSMTPSQRAVSWRSNLPRKSPLKLTSAKNGAWKEVWRVAVGSIWHAEFSGVPESETGRRASDVRVAEFHPRGGESVTMVATRPEASAGSSLAFDSVSMRTQLGGRSRDVSLVLQYRSTSGSQHVIRLPGSAEVTKVDMDGEIQPLRAEDGEITLPIRPGQHTVTIDWREAGGASMKTETSQVDIGALSSNIQLRLELPDDRWLLATRGPKLGPAVLYWSELAVLVLFAAILGRVGLSPLQTRHWLLLGLGFSMFSWPALAWVVVWLLACGARERWQISVNWWRFNAIQIGIAALTLIAIASIVGSLPRGLLGSPDMHVVGNNSYGNTLAWFADRADSALPTAYAYSLPLWIYKVLILLWALWLSFALLRWLPWVWRCFSSQGYWRSRRADMLDSSSGGD